ncbi:tmem65 [Symbiodinium necroappetens]|uniref:Tmem65 protein n=1 Tax=Symbiodinium necroappetens TaxID=1628268 RepID=A0A813ACB6_9DINO|nr:tmem65 [Symbiodinium necroappetens]
MLGRLRTRAQRSFAQIPRFRPPARGASSRRELVKGLAAAVEHNPAVAPHIAELLDDATADKVAKVLETFSSEGEASPTKTQLRMAATAAAIPFFGFGVLDNAIMILLGEVIDATLCVQFGLSTMAAAALGNTFSDAVGVFSGTLVEEMAAKYGVEAPKLTRVQEGMAVTKNYERLGQLVGICIGCLVGMFPLLFMDHSDVRKREKALDEMFDVVVESVTKLLDCEAALLFLVDYEKRHLYLRSSSDHALKDHLRIGEGVAGRVAETGHFMNVDDLRKTELYNPKRHDDYFGTGVSVRSVLCMPVIGVDPADQETKVLGVLQLINKRGTEGHGFLDRDEDVCAALCSQISTSLSTAYGLSSGFRAALERYERALNMPGVRLNPAQDSRLENIYEEVMRDCTEVLRGSATILMVGDVGHKDDLILKVSDKVPSFRTSAAEAPVLHKCKEDGVTICVNDLVNSRFYKAEVHEDYRNTGMNLRAVLASPCISTDGEVLAVLACLKDADVAAPFSASDVRFLNAVANNVAINLQGTGASLQNSGRSSEIFGFTVNRLHLYICACVYVYKYKYKYTFFF